MNIRKPSVAGLFYPKDPFDLKKELEDLFALNKADGSFDYRHIAGIIAPHAGYVYSGAQAAKAYSYLKGRQYKLVCIISPSHRLYFNATSISSHDAYRTPLGDMPIDSIARDITLSCKGIERSIRGHDKEHALEVQLPFVQHLFGNIPILPMVMGDQSLLSIENLAKCISTLYAQYGRDILFIASSDLSHFHDAKTAKTMDGKFIELLQKAKSDELYNLLYSEDVEACGGGAILALLKGLKINKNEIKVLAYTHSGEVSNDNSSVVGYSSAILMKDEG
ncbi:MAG: AmmeMemoRadiSam system protein B [Candidatus Neomarinimicrobiota bacterium]